MLISKLNNYTGRKSQSQYLFSLLQKYDISSIFSKKSSEAIENQYSVDNLPEIIPKKYNDLDEFSKEMLLHFIENTTAAAAAKIYFGKKGI